MVTIDETIAVLYEALPQGRRRHSLVAVLEEPPASEPSSAKPPRTVQQSQHRQSSADLTAVRVLVVDDDESSRDYFSFALETCGAVVSLAMNAREALDLLSRESPDVILSDIAMPGEDGYWLLSEIRRHSDRGVRQLPVVAATAYSHHSRAQSLAAGFQEHLSKPVDPDVLCRVIAAAIGR